MLNHGSFFLGLRALSGRNKDLFFFLDDFFSVFLPRGGQPEAVVSFPLESEWLWSRKRCWPAIITPGNLKLFRRKIWEQLFSFSANYLRHSEIIPFPTNSISEDDYHLEIKHSFEARCLLLFEFL